MPDQLLNLEILLDEFRQDNLPMTLVLIHSLLGHELNMDLKHPTYRYSGTVSICDCPLAKAYRRMEK